MPTEAKTSNSPNVPNLTADQWVILRAMRLILLSKSPVRYSAEYIRIWEHLRKSLSPADILTAFSLLGKENK